MAKIDIEEDKQEKSPRPCPRDCTKCTMVQQVYCCTKMVFDQSLMIRNMNEEITRLKDELHQLKNDTDICKGEFSEPNNIAQ